MTDTPTALVTGTSTGIGLATAVALTRAGWQVTATMRDPSRADRLRAAATDAGLDIDDGSLEIHALDVTDDASVAAAVAVVLANHGRIDLVVNNAGSALVGTLEQTTPAEMAAAMDVNFEGPVRVMRAVLPSMRAARSGRIVNVSSVVGVVGQPFNDLYCAAKFALEGLSESLAPTLATFGIHLSVVEPGPVATEFVATATKMLGERGATPDDPYAALFDAYMRRTSASLQGAQTAEEVADAILAVVIDPEPKLRYQTSEASQQFAAVKLADLDGSRVAAMTAAWIAP